MESLARYLVIFGIILILIGGLIFVIGRLGIPLGNLPGDIKVVREHITCLFPIVTSIILSIVLTFLLNLLIQFFGRK